MTIALILLLAFVAVVIAGGSLRRKGRWSQRTYGLAVLVMAVICIAAMVVALRSS